MAKKDLKRMLFHCHVQVEQIEDREVKKFVKESTKILKEMIKRIEELEDDLTTSYRGRR